MTGTIRCLILIAAAFLISSIAWAQQGSITGSVRDTSGAAVPNATITITNTQQGLTRIVTTNTSGDYLVSGLPAGTYDILVQAQGFEKFQIKTLSYVSPKEREPMRL